MPPFPGVPGAHLFLVSFRRHSLGGLCCVSLCFSSAVCVPSWVTVWVVGLLLFLSLPSKAAPLEQRGGEWDLVETSSELLSLA